MSYIKWDDVISRYPVAGRNSEDATEVTDSFINGAEAYINAKLAKTFTVPFSDAPELIKDLTIDLTYAKMAVGKLDDRKAIKDHVDDTLKELVNGEMALVTSSGDVFEATGDGVWSEHGDYVSTFDVDDPFNWEVDQDRIDDIEDDRDS